MFLFGELVSAEEAGFVSVEGDIGVFALSCYSVLTGSFLAADLDEALEGFFFDCDFLFALVADSSFVSSLVTFCSLIGVYSTIATGSGRLTAVLGTVSALTATSSTGISIFFSIGLASG